MSSDRKALIRLASTLPKGSDERRTLLSELQKVSAEPIAYKRWEVVQSPVFLQRGNYELGRDTDYVDGDGRAGEARSPRDLYKEFLRKWGPGLKDRTNWDNPFRAKVVCQWYGGDDFDPLSRQEEAEWRGGSEEVSMYRYELTIEFFDDAAAKRFMKEK